jgi:hypothetical protein
MNQTFRVVGCHEDNTYEASQEEKQRLQQDMEMVLSVLERSHPGTLLSYIGGPVNPEHPCRFRRNPPAPRDDPCRELSFTCQVQNDKMVAIVPLESMFVRTLIQDETRDLETYREQRDVQIYPGEMIRRHRDLRVWEEDGTVVYINLTYEINRTQNTTKRSCLFMAPDAAEFAQLLDILLDTKTFHGVTDLINNPEVDDIHPFPPPV